MRRRAWLTRRRYNPAYAGTTFIVGGELISMLIQPRVCGDYTYVVNSGRGLHDTTPRMRGLLPHAAESDAAD